MDSSIHQVLKGKTPKPSLVILGAGGLGKVAEQIAKHQDKYEVVGFCDDKFEGMTIENNQLLASFEEINSILEEPSCVFVIAIGNSKIRSNIFKRVNIPEERFVNVIHPKAFIDTNVTLGTGNLLMPNIVIHSGVTIKNYCIVNSASVIEHKSVVSSFVSISPNATICGAVEIGERCFIGAGSVIIQCLSIGEDTTIGAGSLVIRNQPAHVVAYGSPSKVIKESY